MKTCPKCKMQIRDEDKICQFCGAAQMTDDSPMKKYEQDKADRRNTITPERRRAKRQENMAIFINFLIIVGFIAIFAFVISIFFRQEFMDMINDIVRFFKNLMNR